MPYEFYKVMHLFGIILIFFGLGALGHHAFMAGPKKFPSRKILFITHGVGMLLALVGGFGLMARLGIKEWPMWIILKLVIWLALGMAGSWMLKRQKIAMLNWILVPLLALLAIYLVNYKPM